MKIPVVTLVVGGDDFTLEKVKETTKEESDSKVPPGHVVIVDGSGCIANMLADIYKKLEEAVSR
ncbi:MAG: hypothetical protein F6K35_14190 [Okeania sp. SIO2H7]|nr:hypothetical protein [Okeania sp. SIO2H7]